MSMTLQDCRTFVRGYVDIDTSDIADTVMDVLLREGYNRITHAERHWAFYQAEATFSTVVAQQAYTFASLGGTTPFVTLNGVEGPHWRIDPLPHMQARQAFVTISGPKNAEPRFFSTFNSSLYLWPKPVGVYALLAQGYRAPADWVAGGAGSVPDLPDEFHELICKWAIKLAYAQQNDPISSAFFGNEFESILAALRRSYVGNPTQGVMALNSGAHKVTSPYNVIGEARYPFGVQR
jgi:hypothetical protein